MVLFAPHPDPGVFHAYYYQQNTKLMIEDNDNKYLKI